MKFLNNYQPNIPMPPKCTPPKCASAERDPLENFYSNMMDRAIKYGELRKENKELRNKLENAREEKKRWENKYLELYNYVKKMEDTTSVTIDPMWERIKLGLGVPPIDQSLYDDDSKPKKFGIRYMY